MRASRIALAMVILFTMAGCGLTNRQRIQAADVTYTGLLAAAYQYSNRPMCSAVVKTDCADPEAVRTMQTIDKGAEAVLDDAQTRAANPSIADADLSPVALAVDSALTSLRAYLASRGIVVEAQP